MNVNFEEIEKAWFKPKKTVLDKLEEWCRENRKIASENLSILISGTEQAKRMATRFVVYDEFLNKIQELKKENENGRIF